MIDTFIGTLGAILVAAVGVCAIRIVVILFSDPL